ncbi:MAG TPA: glycoside hydrolase family 43 protein [Anaerolineae bacterium]|nr:glycoside hydrolase family 43 protein [Anaerolineae bacterium]
MIHNRDLQIRDPFVLPVATEQRYYLYGTTDPDPWKPPAQGFDVYIGEDLEHWEGPFPAFRPPSAFWADRNFWAPEVHAYQGRYYMFASFKAPEVRRGTQILVSDAPGGPFIPHSAGPVTPAAWECLDGTLFVDNAQTPWLVFCHEWVQVGDGEICIVRLTPDLRAAVDAPTLLFRASAAPWAQEVGTPERHGYVTDGPFLHRTTAGALLLLWSSFGVGGYTLAVARSVGGQLVGPWEHLLPPLYATDGGHAMVFRAFTGQWMLSLHHPNRTPDERPQFLPLCEEEDTLRVLPNA